MLPFIGGFQEVLFPGFLAVGFGVAGASLALGRRRAAAGTPPRERETAIFYALVLIVAFWASLGPSAGLYALFYRTIPIFSYLRAPSRIGLVVALALAVLASLAIARLLRARPRAARLVGPALAAVAVAEAVVVPLPFKSWEPLPTVYDSLAQQPYGPVLELPFYWLPQDYHRHTEYMLWSTYHWKPLVNGYSDNIPSEFREIATPLSSFPSPDAFRLLQERRVRYVVVHLHKYARVGGQRVLADLENRYDDSLRLIAVDPNPFRERGPDRHPLNQVRLYEITKWPTH